MNSKGALNKQVKIKKSQNNQKPQQASLKGQTTKIQNKLEFLKAQIAMRKTLKNKQKELEQPPSKNKQQYTTGQSWSTSNKVFNPKSTFQANSQQLNKFLLGNPKTKQQNLQKSEGQTKLQNLLQQLKMEQYKSIVIEKYAVDNIQKLLQLSEEQIDEWKSIPVGFRIKLRKIIVEHHKKKSQSVVNQQNSPPDDIQHIIKRRKQQRIFEPINDKKFEEGEEIQEDCEPEYQDYSSNKMKRNQKQVVNQSQQDQQDILISSLNSAFLQRKSIIKKQSSMKQSSPQKSAKQKVHWDDNVKQYNKQTSKFRGQFMNTRYPRKQDVQISHDGKQGYFSKERQRINYCWTCFKRIQDKDWEIQQRQDPEQQQDLASSKMRVRKFCNQTCKQNYKKLVQTPIDQQPNFKDTKNTQKTTQRKKGLIKQEEEQQQDIQIIDLDIN